MRKGAERFAGVLLLLALGCGCSPIGQEDLACGRLDEGSMVAATGETALSSPPEIVGPVWQWVQTLYGNDSKATPAKSESYTVQFGADGTVNVKADCNLKGGRYSGKGRQLAIEITHSTMAACPEDSLEAQFVRDLIGAANWFLKDDNLYIDLKFDSGTMQLKK